MSDTKPKLALISSMTIFSTIGIFRRYIPLPSGTVAAARAVIGMLFLVTVLLVKGRKISIKGVKRNLFTLCLSGILLGLNWILLFEAYNYTSVAAATLCYYMAPIILILFSPLLFKERFTVQKLLCAAVAVVGMTLVSGMFSGAQQGSDNLKGVLLGLAAAVFYAAVVTCNKKMKDTAALDRTVVQLGISAVMLVPYTFVAEDFTASQFTPAVVLLLITVGVVHTGFAYALYFGCIDKLKAQTVALYSYIDPVGAVILSALLLKEPMGIFEIVGAVLILGAALLSDFVDKKNKC